MYSVWSARDRFGSYKSIWQKIPLFPWMGVGLLFHFPSLLVLLFAALSSLSYRKRDIGWDTCVSTLDSFSYFMCFTCLKPPWSYHLENEQLLITLWDGKKTQYHYSNQSNISSAQGLKMCDDPSETSLHPWHMHKVLFMLHAQWSPILIIHRSWAFLLCCARFAAVRFQLCLVPQMKQMKASFATGSFSKCKTQARGLIKHHQALHFLQEMLGL